MSLRPRKEQRPAILQKIAEVNGLGRQRKLPGIGTGEYEKCLDHRLHLASYVAAFVDRRDIGGFIARTRTTHIEGGQQRRQRASQFVSDIGGKSPLAGEGGIQAGKKSIELFDDGREFRWCFRGMETNREIAFAHLVDISREALHGPNPPADDPKKYGPGNHNSEGTQSKKHPAEILQAAPQGDRIGRDGEQDDARAVGIGRIPLGVWFDGGRKRHPDRSPGPAIGKPPVAKGDALGGCWARQFTGAQRRRADHHIRIDPCLEIIRMVRRGEFGQFVRSIIEDDLPAMLLGRGGDGPGLGQQCVIERGIGGLPNAEIQRKTKQSQNGRDGKRGLGQ